MRSTSVSSNLQQSQVSTVREEIGKFIATEATYTDQLNDQDKALENKKNLIDKVLNRYEGIKISYATAQRNLQNLQIAKWVKK